MREYFGTAYPSWYVEGFAEYVSTAEFKSGKITVGNYSMGRAIGLMNATWVPLDNVITDRLIKMTPEELSQSYAEC